MNGRADGQTERLTNGRMDEGMTNGRMDEGMKCLMDERTNIRIEGLEDRLTGAWFGRKMD
jgi:hypothetical protein